VLDLGCGSGDLLALLKDRKKVKGQGIERSEDAIFKCVEKGLSVFHLDFDSGLSSYPDNSFDYVILNQSLQEALHVEYVLKEALRVGQRVIVGFPNFGNFRARFQLFFRGRTPVTRTLPYLWYNSPNLHFLTVSDFRWFIMERGIEVLDSRFLSRDAKVRYFPNLFAVSAVFVLTR
jgi:methionine biosynthesis protein MetW